MNSQGSSPHLLLYQAEYVFIIATLFTLLQVPNDNIIMVRLLVKGINFYPPKMIPVGPYRQLKKHSSCLNWIHLRKQSSFQ